MRLRGVDLTSADLSLMPALLDAQAAGQFPSDASWAFVANEVVGYDVEPLNLADADLRGANLARLDLRCAVFRGADLADATLHSADLGRADLSSSKLIGTNLEQAKLRGADLSYASLIRTRLEGADLAYSYVYGIAVWDVQGRFGENNLFIGPARRGSLRTDTLALCQFVNALAHDRTLSQLIDVLATNLVLLLGNFGEGRKEILNEMARLLRASGFRPIIFDFSGPLSQDTTGTVETLARVTRFIVADITDPRSVPHELATIVPFLRTTPVLLVREDGNRGYSMVEDLTSYPWVTDVIDYGSRSGLSEMFGGLIERAVDMSRSLHR